MPVRLTVRRQGGQIMIEVEADPPLTSPAMVQLVGYREAAKVEIARGENAGLAIEYRNIVTSWDQLGDWSGQEPLSIRAPDIEGRAVVIVQRAGLAEILAAVAVE